MEQVSYGHPTCMYGLSHMLSVFLSYMTLMVPSYLIWNRYHMVPPHVYIVPTLLYMEQVSYGPLTCMYGPPHVKCLHVLYDSRSPHTLYGKGIIWFPTCMYGLPHM